MIIPLFENSSKTRQPAVEEQVSVDPQGWQYVRNVTNPSLTAYLPAPGSAAGAAVIVCPGGAWHWLSVSHEGEAVCQWLAERGVAAFMLKYHLMRTTENYRQEANERIRSREGVQALAAEIDPLVLADGQQAVRVVRKRAAEWGLNPDRVGMLGFSAGGMVVTNVALAYDKTCRPAFVAPIYTAPFAERPVPADAPPMFVLCAADDQMAAPLSLRLFSIWQTAGRSCELHIYAQGGHGFGMRQTGLPSDHWIERFYDWLKAQHMLD